MNNELKILNCLGKNLGKAFTMRELSKAVKVPYATFYRTLHKMKDLVRIKEIGKSKIVSLNTGNPSIKSYLVVSSEEEKKEFLAKHPVISKIAAELKTGDIVVLFGSYAKGTEKKESDIDFLIINKKGDRSILFSKYEFLFKKKINPIFISKEEFRQMLKEKEDNVGKQALENNIILNDAEGFWRCVLNGKL